MVPVARFLLMMVVVFWTGCGGEDPPGECLGDNCPTADVEVTNSDVGDATNPDALPPLPDGAICYPGTRGTCVPGNAYQILECASDGSGFIPVACTGPDGAQSVCLGDACTVCVPGDRRCRDDDAVERCNDVGSEWELAEECEGATTGRRCENGTCQRLCELAAKLFTYMGCDYWAVDMDNAFVPGGPRGFYDAQGAQFAVVVGNPDDKRPATIQISNSEGLVTEDSSGGLLDLSPVPPKGLRIFNLPRRDVNGTVIAPLAYSINASIPVTAYQFNPLENVGVFSNDASLLLPENVLGKYYIVMTREQTFDSLRGYVTIAAVRPGETTVTVTVTAKTLASTAKGSDGQPIIPSMNPGDSRSFVLSQYDVLNIETNKTAADLTGTVVLADREVAVYGGSEASNVPNTNHCNFEFGVCEWPLSQGIPPNQAKQCDDHEDCDGYITCCADHLEEQMFPVRTWGKHYLATKSFDRNLESDSWRIMAAEDGTLVTTFPHQLNIPVLNRGEWFDFESKSHFEIVANKPILVGQYLAAEQAPSPNVNGIPGAGDAGTGDPAFMLAVPKEQYRSDYVILAPNAYQYDHINIVAPVDSVVSFDDEVLEAHQFEPVTPEYHVVRLQIGDGVHRIESDMPVGVTVYGYDSYVSYGYPGGLDLKDLKLLETTF